MNRDALFCDGTQDYVIPAEPEAGAKVLLRFRTAHNDVEEVELLTEDSKYAMWTAIASSLRSSELFRNGDLRLRKS